MAKAKRKPRKLTEAEWKKVFVGRCKSKRGEPVTAEERKLINLAFDSDLERYTDMEADVFNATVPFGSNVRWR